MHRLALLLATVTLGCAHQAPPLTAPIPSVAAAPNGLWWDAASHTLLIADEASSSVLSWRDDGAAIQPLSIPAGSQPGLGQVVRLTDGTVVVARFGHGETGAIVVFPPGGAGKVLPGLDPKRRRIGLAVAPSGGVFSSWFLKGGTAGVSEVGLDGTEHDLVVDLVKPVGLTVGGDFLYVADQTAGAVLRCPARACSALETVGKVDKPDLLAPGPDGSVLAGSRAGGVTLVCPDGHTRALATSTDATRGVAYDPAGGRLFYIEHGKDSALRTLAVKLGDDPCAAATSK